MSRFTVRCQSASGQTLDVTVRARSESAATREALAQLPKSEGWLAIYALEG